MRIRLWIILDNFHHFRGNVPEFHTGLALLMHDFCGILRHLTNVTLRYVVPYFPWSSG